MIKLFSEYRDNTLAFAASTYNQTKYYPRPEFPSPSDWPSKEIRASFVTSDYRETSEHLVDKSKGQNAWVELDQKLDSLPSQQVDALCDAMQNGEWEAPIFDDTETYPYLGLAALKSGKLNSLQFGTLMAYWSVRYHHDRKEIEIIKIFNKDGTPNQKAVEIILASLELPENIQKKDSFLTEYLANLKKYSSSESVLFIVPQEKKTEGNRYALPVSKFIKSIGYNLFYTCKQGGEDIRIVSSFGMQQALVDTLNPKERVKIIPKILAGTLEDIERGGLDNSRICSIPFVKKNLPSKADNYHCIKFYDFIYHDCYHAVVCSMIPGKHKELLIALAQEFKKMEFYDPALKQINDLVYEFLVDMNVYYTYEPKVHLSRLYDLLDGLHQTLIQKTVEEWFANQKDYDKLPPEDIYKFGNSFLEQAKYNVETYIRKKNVFQRIANIMAERFKSFFTLDALQQMNEAKRNSNLGLKYNLESKLRYAESQFSKEKARYDEQAISAKKYGWVDMLGPAPVYKKPDLEFEEIALDLSEDTFAIHLEKAFSNQK